jgi:hypothetical protein
MATGRAATENERSWIEHVIAEEHAAWSGLQVLLRGLGVVLGAVVILLAFEKLAVLVVLPVPAAFLLFRFALPEPPKLDAPDAIARIEGVFQGRFVGGGKTSRWQWFIGDVAPIMPGHWVEHLRPGEEVRGEAWFRPSAGADRLGPGVNLVPRHRGAACVVSLNGLLSVDREVPLGLLRLRMNWSFIAAVPPLLIGAMFAVFDRAHGAAAATLIGAGAVALVPGIVRWRRNAAIVRALRGLYPRPPGGRA